ncbi:hypothetical protein [Candidatus Kryptonium thompsonii]|uniref:hypothetical protein n=1 Tax=Candidatus Kryptonium thompsonii TaxID=1633631 RepID=UPI003B219C6B
MFEIPCVVITNDNLLPDNLLDLFTEKQVAVFQTPLSTRSSAISLFPIPERPTKRRPMP